MTTPTRRLWLTLLALVVACALLAYSTTSASGTLTTHFINVGQRDCCWRHLLTKDPPATLCDQCTAVEWAGRAHLESILLTVLRESLGISHKPRKQSKVDEGLFTAQLWRSVLRMS